MTSTSHHSIREAILGRIHAGEWELGELIPPEMSLAEEYGCARTTVNRALQALADDGLLVRKRKGGTRLCEIPVRQAKFDIPIIREQVEANGGTYRHQLLRLEMKKPPASIRSRLGITENNKAMYIETVHFTDDRPFAFEKRWINTVAVPTVFSAPFETLSANEWLIKTVPFSSGDVTFSAMSADTDTANAMGIEKGAALFVINRTTWFDDEFITTLTLCYQEGFQLHSKL